ncbi:MAG: FxLYD domain-containing protein, partial [Thermoanaerobaculia bacterium]
RTTKDTPKARVRITDADVSHPLDLGTPTGEEKKEGSAAAGSGPRVEVADYAQEKNGAALGVRGSLRNSGQGTAENVRMTITAVDEKGQSIDGTTASISKGVIESGQSVEFNASLNVGDKTVATLRFAPQWTVPRPPPPPPGRPGQPADASAAGSGKAPAPRPTPYGRGTLYAPPVASAPFEAPADGKTGYIPGASHPDNQPKPPIP